jgi:hypothetical protein
VLADPVRPGGVRSHLGLAVPAPRFRSRSPRWRSRSSRWCSRSPRWRSRSSRWRSRSPRWRSRSPRFRSSARSRRSVCPPDRASPHSPVLPLVNADSLGYGGTGKLPGASRFFVAASQRTEARPGAWSRNRPYRTISRPASHESPSAPPARVGRLCVRHNSRGLCDSLCGTSFPLRSGDEIAKGRNSRFVQTLNSPLAPARDRECGFTRLLHGYLATRREPAGECRLTHIKGGATRRPRVRQA